MLTSRRMTLWRGITNFPGSSNPTKYGCTLRNNLFCRVLKLSMMRLICLYRGTSASMASMNACVNKGLSEW